MIPLQNILHDYNTHPHSDAPANMNMNTYMQVRAIREISRIWIHKTLSAPKCVYLWEFGMFKDN